MPARTPPKAHHTTPHPLINATHPINHPSLLVAHPSLLVAPYGHHRRATVVIPGNPAVVQLHSSDTVVPLPLAQHVTIPMLAVGTTVACIIFDLQDPTDGLIVAAY